MSIKPQSGPAHRSPSYVHAKDGGTCTQVMSEVACCLGKALFFLNLSHEL